MKKQLPRILDFLASKDILQVTNWEPEKTLFGRHSLVDDFPQCIQYNLLRIKEINMGSEAVIIA